MIGLNNQTGKHLDGIEHLKQSIRDILLTPIGTRVMRRDYGSRLFELIDAPINANTIIDIVAATAEALDKWEPRIKLDQVILDGSSSSNNAMPIADILANGQLGIMLRAVYLPDGRALTLESINLPIVSGVQAKVSNFADFVPAESIPDEITDTEPPSIPQNIIATVLSSSEIYLLWDISIDNVSVSNYGIWINGLYKGLTAQNHYNATNLQANTLYSFQIEARDAAGNISAKSTAIQATTLMQEQTPDTEAPSSPQNLVATVLSSSEIYLNWNAATDNIGVTGYGVWINNSYHSLRTQTNLTVSGLNANTLYHFQVDARDAAGNISTKSAVVSATTLAGPIIVATTYFVSPSGSDSNNGTSLATPLKTINAALAKATTANDTIYCLTGTYSEVIEINQSNIRLLAYSGHAPVIDGGTTLPAVDSANLVSITGDYNTFSGFEVKNASPDGHVDVASCIMVKGTHNFLSFINAHHAWEYGILICGDYNSVEDCLTWQCSLRNLDGGSTTYWSTGLSAGRGADQISITHYATFRRCTVYNNWGEGISCFESANTLIEDCISYDNWTQNLYISDSQYCLAQRNIVYCSSNQAFTFAESDYHTGITMADKAADKPRSRNNTVINNFVYNAEISAFSWTLVDGSGLKNCLIANNTLIDSNLLTGDPVDNIVNSNTQIRNNIITGHANSVPSNTGLTFSNNFWTSQPALAASASDLTGNPQLARIGATTAGNLTGDYFKLLNNSPLIDHAARLAAVTTDFFKTLRGANPDIGGHEALPDTQAPSVPTNLLASVLSSTEIYLTWNISTDNVSVAGYGIWINSVYQSVATLNHFSATGLTPSTLYHFQVDARDAAGNISAKTTSVSATTSPAAPVTDTQAPTIPANLVATVLSTTEIRLNWTASTDNVGVIGYGIWIDSVYKTVTSQTSYIASSLTADTAYDFQLDARDAAGNISTKTAVVSATTLAEDIPVGNVYYVSPSGSNTNNGTSLATPLKTINAALAKATTANDTIYCMTGTYTEVIEISQNNIRLLAYAANSPVIDGGTTLPAEDWVNLVLISGDYNTFSGFEVKNASPNGHVDGAACVMVTGAHNLLTFLNCHHAWEQGIMIYGDYNTVEDSQVWQCTLRNLNGGYTGWWSTGMSAGRGADQTSITHYATFRRCTAYNNWGEGISCFEAANTIIEDCISYDNWTQNMYISDSQNCLVQRNLVYCSSDPDIAIRDNYNTGITLADELSAKPRSQNNVIINNLVYNAEISGFYWTMVNNSGLKTCLIANNTLIDSNLLIGGPADNVANSNTQIRNNIITGTGSDVASATGLTFSNNNWATRPSAATGSNDVTGDPLLAETGATTPGDLTGDYFKITTGSPVIDHGMALAAVTVDYFKTARGTPPDIGAHEFTA